MIFKLQGKHQHYNWGGETFIANWLGLADKKNAPYAEYWLGAHSSAPSLIEFEQKWLPLDRVLATVPELLGEQSRAAFGDELPYLLKILDVKLPLSIQLHPTKTQAEQGFAKENEQGIALNDPKRTYKDRNHKPEMMIALSDFWLLHGFKPKATIIKDLQKVPSLRPLANRIAEQGLPTVYAEIMQAEQPQLAEWLMPIIEQHQAAYQQGELEPTQPEYWILYCLETMAIPMEKLDAGLLSFYLFNIVHLNVGEGIYQGAGLPHAYLRGQNIELMAASDNVIRGGLTPKYIDIPALLATIDYREVVPEIIPRDQPTANASPLSLYPTPQATDFALQRLVYRPFDECTLQSSSASILLVMAGNLSLDLGDRALHLQQGEAIFISAESQITTIGVSTGYAVVATLP